MSFVADLEPKALWRHFDEILRIPRGSGNEEGMRRYVIGVAETHGLEHATDAATNLVVRKPGRAGRESAAVTILQSHLDMVNEKNSEVDHDFAADFIKPRRQGEYLTATGTTLGADNGIGVAAMLAMIADDDVDHGPLELLFTVDEETGLTGAGRLDPELLAGRQLLNLDSEEEGAVYIGCAGGGDTRLALPLRIAPAPRGAVALEVSLKGLRGGHSGVDIHLQRGNAIQLLARALDAGHDAAPFRLAALAAGRKHNAIPREARATLVTDAAGAEAIHEAIGREGEAIGRERRPIDPDAAFRIEPAAAPESAWEEETTAAALRLLLALPHGVQAMSPDIPDLVETSANLAAANVEGGSLVVLVSTRSSVDSALSALRRRIRAAGALAGAEVREEPGYPGWKPDLDSPLLALVRSVHTELFGKEPALKAIHAGLECGIIGRKFPGMDMVSIGPRIESPHSPDERVEVASVGRFYRLLTATLEALATGG